MRRYYGRLRFAIAIAIVVAVAAYLVVGAKTFSFLISVQPGPLLVWFLAGATGISAIVIGALVVSTAFFGRYFCAVLCPFGTVQDVVIAYRPNRRTSIPNLKVWRYAIAGLSIVMLVGGWAVLFRILDPFSRFSAFVAAVIGGLKAPATFSLGALLGGIAPMIILMMAARWKKRIYCSSFCPVGTLLGLVSRVGIYGLRVHDSCIGCGACEAVCPTGCIDIEARNIDPERCLLCLGCISVCPKGSISYTRKHTPSPGEYASINESRRRFLIAGTGFTVGVVSAGVGLSGVIQSLAQAAEKTHGLILPPGAFDAARFARQCTACQLCAAHCPAKIIKSSPLGFGPVRLDYGQSGCSYDCVACSEVCPSGALSRLDLVDKQWLKVGEAVLDPNQCAALKDGVPCELCEKSCPKGAIFMMDGPGGIKVPEVAAFHCIGCGACQAACPTLPKAITVLPIEQRPMGS